MYVTETKNACENKRLFHLFPPVNSKRSHLALYRGSSYNSTGFTRLWVQNFYFAEKKNIYPSIVGSFYNGSLRVYEPRQFQSVFQPATAHRIATRREDIPSTETLLVSSIYNNLLVFFNCSFPAAINRWTSLSLNPKWRFLNRRLSRRDYCEYFLLRIIQELTRVFFSPFPTIIQTRIK